MRKIQVSKARARALREKYAPGQSGNTRYDANGEELNTFDLPPEAFNELKQEVFGSDSGWAGPISKPVVIAMSIAITLFAVMLMGGKL